MIIVWTKLALSDLDAACNYISEESPKVARSVIERVGRILVSLEQHPKMGRPGRVDGTRELVIPSLPFVIPYRIENREIHLLAFMHTSRSWPERFE